jgi:hypothetical protein
MKTKCYLIIKNLLKKIKKILPKKVRHILLSIRICERILILEQPYLHKKALRKVQEKVKKGEKIQVAFFLINVSVWKWDELFKMMLSSRLFSPVIVICPIINHGREYMLETLNQCIYFFKEKKYPFIVTYEEQRDTYINVQKEIAPDLIFYTNPYKGLIDNRYFITRFRKVLTCYIPYAFFPVEGKWVFDQLLHNLCWLIFSETSFHIELAKRYERRQAKNMVFTGYPGCDPFLFGMKPQNNVWKNANLKKIIWAPHHIDIKQFVDIAYLFIDITYKYQDKIQVAFKPHPLLKPKLRSYWEKSKIEEYYTLWENLPNGQYENSDYTDLFLNSDALIHNSGSFLTEYFCTGKPCFSTHTNETLKELSEFGCQIIDLHYRISINEIEDYLNRVIINGDDYKKNQRLKFINNFIIPPNNKSATENIFEIIENNFIS